MKWILIRSTNETTNLSDIVNFICAGLLLKERELAGRILPSTYEVGLSEKAQGPDRRSILFERSVALEVLF